MPPTRFPPRVGLLIREDGTTMGTVQQFADRLGLSESAVRTCLHDQEAVILQAGSGPTQLLVVRAEGIDALRRAARGGSQ